MEKFSAIALGRRQPLATLLAGHETVVVDTAKVRAREWPWRVNDALCHVSYQRNVSVSILLVGHS